MLANHLINHQSLLKHLLSSLLACLCAYGIWHSISKSQKIYVTLPVTVAFYNTKGKKIIAPEYIEAQIYAKRSSIKNLLYRMSLSIDLANYNEGTHSLSHETLLGALNTVPDDIVVIHLRPLFSITIEKISPIKKTERTECTPPSLVPTASEVPLEVSCLLPQTSSNLAVPLDTGYKAELPQIHHLP